jgi:hypothetical protein
VCVCVCVSLFSVCVCVCISVSLSVSLSAGLCFLHIFVFFKSDLRCQGFKLEQKRLLWRRYALYTLGLIQSAQECPRGSEKGGKWTPCTIVVFGPLSDHHLALRNHAACCCSPGYLRSWARAACGQAASAVCGTVCR